MRLLNNLAWLFLGETLAEKELLGLAQAGLGILAAQLRHLSWFRPSVPGQAE